MTKETMVLWKCPTCGKEKMKPRSVAKKSKGCAACYKKSGRGVFMKPFEIVKSRRDP